MIARTTIPDDVLISINSLEILGIIYLAIAISALRAQLSRLQGQFDQYQANHKEAK